MTVKQRYFLAALIFVTLAGGTLADDLSPTPAAQANTALHLLEGARYGEAIPAAQALVILAPNDPLSYQIRGTLGLYIGDWREAEQDFATASRLRADDPVTLYGQGVTHIGTKQWASAQAELTAARQAPGLSTAEAADMNTALAYLRYLQGDMAGVRALTASEALLPDPARQELQALIAARTEPQTGAALLAKFLKTDSGVPYVIEAEGIRPLFDSATALEPSVTEPSLQQMYQMSFGEGLAQAAKLVRAAPHLSGAVTIHGPANAGDAAAVTFSIDGDMAGMVNTAPYDFEWHTDRIGNGWHTVRIDTLDTSGNVLQSVSHSVYVQNSISAVTGVTMPADVGLEDRVWNILRLRPARKVAEWTLAALLEQSDPAGAQAHRVVAAALDPEYKDARRVAQSAFEATSAHVIFTAKSSLPGLSQGSTAHRQVALTFDDGPNPQKTPALLDALDKAGAVATFFVVGSRAEAAPDLVRRMVQMGDDVENHSYTHPNMAQTAPSIAESEILRTSVVIHALTGRNPRFFRPPGGQRNPVVYRLASLYGQTVALWTIDALNYEESATPQGLTNFIMKHVKPGAIILMHNGMDNTTAAIPLLTAALRAQGYQMETLTQMTAPHSADKSLAKQN